MRKNITTTGTRVISLIQNKTTLKAYITAILVSACLLQSNHSAAQNIEFVENKGQWDSTLAFKGTYSAGAVALKPDGGYRVMLNNRDDLKRIASYIHSGASGSNVSSPAATKTGLPATKSLSPDGDNMLHSHIYEASFLNANPHPLAVPEKQQIKHHNYFIGKDPSKWGANCGIYNAVTFKNVYPGIDVHYYTSGGNFKYDIIVNPGGDISNVALSINGASGLLIKNGNLVVKTTVDDVTELAPYSYSATAEGNKELKCKYNLNGNVLTFKFNDAIQRGTPLVIDPTLIFCSFSGSTADNWGYTATYDAAGNFYAGGIVFDNGFKITNGAYQTNWKGGNNKTGEGGYDENGNPIDMSGFDMGIMKFNSTGTKVMYATYIGGANGNEQPHSLVADAAGNLIIAGRSTSSDYPTMYPDTIGKCGGQDIVLTELNADGTALIGSLRIGGIGDDGVNIRSKDIPAYGTESIRRNYGDDARSEVILDNAGNICLASCTQSTDFPLYNALFNKSAGAQDAVLLKFLPGLNTKPLLSTYLGGNGNDAAFVLAQSPVTGNLYVAGATASTNFAGTSGVSATTISGKFIGGDCDGFISEISADGSKLIKTVYFGTASADQIYGIDFNATGNLFITGTTEGVVPVVNSPFNSGSGKAQANGKQFITKLQADLSSIVYSANFGPANVNAPNISPTAFLVDVCENVYVSGWGGGLDQPYANSSTAGLTAVLTGAASAQLTSTPSLVKFAAGNGFVNIASSFYFFVLEKDAASQLYGAFLGTSNDYDGVHVDGGTSRFDKNGVIYQAICACGPDNVLASDSAVYKTSNAYKTPGTYGCNVTALKIAFNFSGVEAGVKSNVGGVDYDTAGCVPLTVTLTDTIAKAQKYIWDFGDGSSGITTTGPTTPHTYDKIGTYKVMLIAVDSTKCIPTDTTYINLRVRDNKAQLAIYEARPICDALTYSFTNTSSPIIPGKVFSDTAFAWNFGDGSNTVIADHDTVLYHTYQAPGTYIVSLTILDTIFCNVNIPYYDTLRAATVVKAAFTTPLQGCAPYTAQFTNTSSGGEQFYWSFGDNGATSQNQNPSYTYINPGSYNVQLIAVDTLTCNRTDTAYTTVNVYGSPTANFSYSPQQAQQNTPVTLTNLSTGAVRYKWSFGDGDTLITTTQDTLVSHQYVKSGRYTICLTAYNVAGCSDSTCQPVDAIVLSLVDVPNALTPNGGANPMIHVKGFGIEKMDWKIYNRWGTMIFESTDQSIGWDGRYKGVLQPQEVYVYVLNVEFGDGTKYQKKGDITLLR